MKQSLLMIVIDTKIDYFHYKKHTTTFLHRMKDNVEVANQ